MIQELLIIANSLLFLLIGFYLGRPSSTTVIEKAASPKDSKPVKPKKHFLEKAGIIEYSTQEDIDYVESGEEHIDEARNKAFRENFRV